MEAKLINGEMLTVEDVFDRHSGFLNKLAYKYSKRMPPHVMDFDDLKSIGSMGMMKAFEYWDEGQGVKFLSYASRFMEGYIQEHTKRHKHTVNYSRPIILLAHKIVKENMVGMSDGDIAEKLGERANKIAHAKKYLESVYSINHEVDNGDGADSIEETIGKEEDTTSVFVEDFVNRLPDKLKKVAEGLMNDLKQKEIAKNVDCSPSYISRLTNQIGQLYLKYERGEEMAHPNLPQVKELLANTDKDYKQIEKETGVPYVAVVNQGKKIRKDKPATVKQQPKQEQPKDDYAIILKEDAAPSKGNVKELERERDSWKAQHDDLMKKYEAERKRNENLESSNYETTKKAASFADKITQLESQLEAYQTNGNPIMVSKLNEALGWKDEELRDLNKKLVRADGERDEAMQYAQEMKEKFEQVIKEAKEYEMEYEARYKNMKAQRDSLVTAYNMALEASE